MTYIRINLKLISVNFDPGFEPTSLCTLTTRAFLPCHYKYHPVCPVVETEVSYRLVSTSPLAPPATHASAPARRAPITSRPALSRCPSASYAPLHHATELTRLESLHGNKTRFVPRCNQKTPVNLAQERRNFEQHIVT